LFPQRLEKRPLDPSVFLVPKRFALRLAILLLFAAMPFMHGWSFAQLFIVLSGVNAMSCSLLALLHRERPLTSALTHWDEALAMAALCVIGVLVLHRHG
jgi:hypothetical protein